MKPVATGTTARQRVAVTAALSSPLVAQALDLAMLQALSPLAQSALQTAAQGYGAIQRENPREPLFHHALRVAAIVRQRFRMRGAEVFTVAILHDVLEKTAITESELRDRFGDAVADDVVALSKPELTDADASRLAYEAQILAGSPAVQVVKLADLIDNLATRFQAGDFKSTLARARRFLALLEGTRQSEVSAARHCLARLVGEIAQPPPRDLPPLP